MHYATTGGNGFFHWMFTLNGILSIIILAGMIYLIISFVQGQKRNKNNQSNQTPTSSSGTNIAPYDEANENSFWDDFNQTEDLPQRDEEPIPPNAIPPSPTYFQPTSQEMNVGQEMVTEDVNEWQKDCTKKMQDDPYVAEPPPQNVSLNKDEKGE